MNWREDIAERLSLPAEVAGATKLTMSGRNRLLIENHRGILGLSDECVEIAGYGVKIRILGGGLDLEAMDKEAVLITGGVAALEFE